MYLFCFRKYLKDNYLMTKSGFYVVYLFLQLLLKKLEPTKFTQFGACFSSICSMICACNFEYMWWKHLYPVSSSLLYIFLHYCFLTENFIRMTMDNSITNGRNSHQCVASPVLFTTTPTCPFKIYLFFYFLIFFRTK